MATINRTLATLRIIGDNLKPKEITSSLGSGPTNEQVKGQVFVGNNTGRKRTAQTGMWRLSASEQIPGDLDSQITEILSKLNNDISVWDELAREYSLDLFCGLFMDKSIEGIDLSPESLKKLGERHISLGLDIYGPDEIEDEDA